MQTPVTQSMYQSSARSRRGSATSVDGSPQSMYQARRGSATSVDGSPQSMYHARRGSATSVDGSPQSMYHARRGSATSVDGSPAGALSIYRAGSQQLPLDLRTSDPLSLHDPPRPGAPLNASLTPADFALGAPNQAPGLAQSRLTRESAESSASSVSATESGSPGTHVMLPGSHDQGGGGVGGGRPNLDRAAMSVLQVSHTLLIC